MTNKISQRLNMSESLNCDGEQFHQYQQYQPLNTPRHEFHDI